MLSDESDKTGVLTSSLMDTNLSILSGQRSPILFSKKSALVSGQKKIPRPSSLITERYFWYFIRLTVADFIRQREVGVPRCSPTKIHNSSQNL